MEQNKKIIQQTTKIKKNSVVPDCIIPNFKKVLIGVYGRSNRKTSPHRIK
jgi:hypothetical protein